MLNSGDGAALVNVIEQLPNNITDYLRWSAALFAREITGTSLARCR
jgi:hypothetical protein